MKAYDPTNDFEFTSLSSLSIEATYVDHMLASVRERTIPTQGKLKLEGLAKLRGVLLLRPDAYQRLLDVPGATKMIQIEDRVGGRVLPINTLTLASATDTRLAIFRVPPPHISRTRGYTIVHQFRTLECVHLLGGDVSGYSYLDCDHKPDSEPEPEPPVVEESKNAKFKAAFAAVFDELMNVPPGPEAIRHVQMYGVHVILSRPLAVSEPDEDEGPIS